MQSTALNPDQLERHFLKSLQSLHPDLHNVSFILAYSGGPDSTVLLSLLNKYKTQFHYELKAVYINHGIRSVKEMEEERVHIDTQAGKLGVPLYTKDLDHGFLDYYSRLKGCGIEAAARDFRYHYLNKIRNKSKGSACIVLGHNQNDQLETILMRFLGGSGLDGLKGIPPSSDILIRPLLGISKDSILKYLEHQGISCFQDSTNQEEDYLRNKLRLDLMPHILDIFPGAKRSILQISEDIKSMLHHYSDLLEDACSWNMVEDSFVCNSEQFYGLPPVSRRRMVLEKINLLLSDGSRKHRIPRSFLNPLDETCSKTQCLVKGYGVSLVQEGKDIILSRENRQDNQYDTVFFHLEEGCPYEEKLFSLFLHPAGNAVEDHEILYMCASDSRIILKKDKETLSIMDKGQSCIVLNLSGEKVFQMEKIGKRKKNLQVFDQPCVIMKIRGSYAP